MPQRPSASALARGGGLLLLWTLVGLAFASQFYLSSTMLGRTVTWSEALIASLGDWYVWAVLSVPILWLARRLPPDAAPRWRTALLHVGAALVFSFAYVLLRAVVGEVNGRLLGEETSFAEIFRPLLLRTFPFNLLIYGVIVALSHALGYYRKYHARTVQTLELEKHLAQARLQALLHQLQPHFLFNTLNGIASLMYSDVDAADTMLVRLSELLRLCMSQSGAPVARLADELAFVERYLEIEKIRFRGRLEVAIDIPAEVRAAQVPTLILQPLVENAIRHGIEPQARPGKVTIRAGREGAWLRIEVIDNGAGLHRTGSAAGAAPAEADAVPVRRRPGAAASPRTGIGLSNTRARLRELYGDRQELELLVAEGGGCHVRLTLPLDEPAANDNRR